MNAGMMLLKSMGIDPEMIRVEVDKVLAGIAAVFARVETKIDANTAEICAINQKLDKLLNAPNTEENQPQIPALLIEEKDNSHE